jgi:nitrite reductase/ring-hydroxylating ferredoxin subunit
MPEPKKGEHRLCALDDLADGEGKSITAGGKDLAVFRLGDELFCFENVCPHKGGSLHDGVLNEDKKTIQCRWHFKSFDLESGGPAGGSRSRATVHPLDIRDGDVFVRLKNG